MVGVNVLVCCQRDTETRLYVAFLLVARGYQTSLVVSIFMSKSGQLSGDDHLQNSLNRQTWPPAMSAKNRDLIYCFFDYI